MVALLRCLSSLVLFVGQVESRRIVKRQSGGPTGSKFIAGVPVLNYDALPPSIEESSEEEWVVVLKPDATNAQIEGLCQHSRMGCQMKGHPDSGGVPCLGMKGTEKDLEAVVKSNLAVVKFIDRSMPWHVVPELDADPNASPHWGLNRVGADRRGSNQGAGVHIYILDTGVRSTHQDFGGRASQGVDVSTGTPRECNGDLDCAVDRNGHGTHCAGTAAGDSFGVASQAAVYGVKVMLDSGAGAIGIVGGIDWMASSAARPAVASMSLGGPCIYSCEWVFATWKVAIDAAVQAGVTVVVAAANSNWNACGFGPGYIPSTITVGATDSEDVRSSFSNYGSCVDIWAPGSDITSASHLDDVSSQVQSGTSMACPHVSGGAALVLENNPTFNADQVLNKLLANSAVDYITDLKYEDSNNLLYVAEDAPPPKGTVPPPPAPTPAPPTPAPCPWWCGGTCLVSACEGCC